MTLRKKGINKIFTKKFTKFSADFACRYFYSGYRVQNTTHNAGVCPSSPHLLSFVPQYGRYYKAKGSSKEPINSKLT